MLSRTVLRFCVLEALRPSACLDTDSNYPTLAKRYVFDSRFDAIDDLKEDERRPSVAIYTETTRVDKKTRAGFNFEARIDLVFEIAVFAMGRDDSENYVSGFAESDAEVEADLDLLEDQIFFALSVGPSGVLFRDIALLPLDDWHSTIHRSPEEGYRLGLRTIRVPIRMKELCYAAAPPANAVGLARLPQPLRGAVEKLANTHHGAAIAAGLAPSAPVMPAAVPFNGMRMDIDSKSPPSPAESEPPHIVGEVNGLQGS